MCVCILKKKFLPSPSSLCCGGRNFTEALPKRPVPVGSRATALSRFGRRLQTDHKLDPPPQNEEEEEEGGFVQNRLLVCNVKEVQGLRIFSSSALWQLPSSPFNTPESYISGSKGSEGKGDKGDGRRFLRAGVGVRQENLVTSTLTLPHTHTHAHR